MIFRIRPLGFAFLIGEKMLYASKETKVAGGQAQIGKDSFSTKIASRPASGLAIFTGERMTPIGASKEKTGDGKP